MQAGQWYELEDEDGFIEYARKINSAIVEYLAGRPFKVISVKGNGDVMSISFDGETPLARLDCIPEFDASYGELWFSGNYEDEGEFFKQIPHQAIAENAQEKAYGVMTFVATGGPITIRASKVTQKVAEELADEYVRNHTNSHAIVFKGISIYALETQPRVIKEDY